MRIGKCIIEAKKIMKALITKTKTTKESKEKKQNKTKYKQFLQNKFGIILYTLSPANK